jgi:hypothetical protein
MIRLPIGDIIRDSFGLAWKHKYLWLFGLFAGTGGGGFNIPGRNITPEKIEAFKEWFLAVLAMVILVGGLVLLVMFILHVISKSALIYNIYQLETNGVHSLSAGWDFGLKRFWPMMGVTLLEIVIVMAFIIVLVGIEIVLFAIALPLGFLSLLLVIPAGIIGLVAILLTWAYAERFVALEMRGVVDSIGEAWALIRQQWQPTIMMGLVKFAISIAVAIAMMGIGALLMAPAIALWLASKPLAILYGIAVGLPYLALVSAYFGTFDYAVWTKVFLHLRAPAYAAAQGGSAPPMAPPPLTPPSPPSAPPPVFE